MSRSAMDSMRDMTSSCSIYRFSISVKYVFKEEVRGISSLSVANEPAITIVINISKTAQPYAGKGVFCLKPMYCKGFGLMMRIAT
jgi:hypothetical protein